MVPQGEQNLREAWFPSHGCPQLLHSLWRQPEVSRWHCLRSAGGIVTGKMTRLGTQGSQGKPRGERERGGGPSQQEEPQALPDQQGTDHECSG